MRIAAALCWFDEPPAMIERCVRSLAGTVDLVVAFDGRWEGFDSSAGDRSPVEQLEALRDAAADADLDLIESAAGSPWKSQIEKRDAMMVAAARCADWTIVIDADDRIVWAGAVRDNLASTDLDVAEVTARWVIGRRPTSAPRRRLFRCSAGVRVTGAHNGYLSSDGRWLHAPPNVQVEPVCDLSTELVIDHDPSLRSIERSAAMTTYYDRRAQSREETLRYEVLA